MNQPLVSCIMPTANRQKYIPFAIDKFFSQNYLNSELVIIDDGEQSISSLLPEDSRIQYFYFNENQLLERNAIMPVKSKRRNHYALG